MNEIQIFKNDLFGEIRTMTDEHGEPWFVGKDVAVALGYSNSRKALLDHVDNEDRKDGVTIRDAIGRPQKTVLINESGLYSLILSSKLESAKAFKRWVTSEVLPQIRKTGGYAMQPMTDFEVLCRAVLISDKRIKELTAQIEELAPKADYVDEVLDSVSCFTMTQVAKELEMSVHELTKLLMERHIIYYQSGQYMLYVDYAHRGFARNRTHSYRDLLDELHTKTYLVWTERGRKFIHDLVSLKEPQIPQISQIKQTTHINFV